MPPALPAPARSPPPPTQSVDIETGAATTVFNANPQGWAGESDKSWVTFMVRCCCVGL